MQTTVTDRGQTSIPAAIRRRHKLKPQSKLIWLDFGTTISVIPVSGDPMKLIRGMFKRRGLTKLLLEQRRQERERVRP
ncbi:MAG: AbrB/MazE/SpoVT family DNA-binding domain-containing protein [Candidatus Omnitrophica bacterium]|nr:AbrB/MazE/SpoVT family DNA-binding domain-containing protein [Candidatus Omnitrophota bacterium]